MLEFLCYSLVWIFAIYGFIEIIKVLFYTFIKTPAIKNSDIHMIIEVKNCENYIETFIRTLFFKILNYQSTECTQVTIVDMNSTDNTKKILKNLNHNFNFEFKEN